MSGEAERDWVEHVLGFPIPTGDGPYDLGRALKAWQSARGEVVAQLRSLSSEIDASGDRESTQAIILLQAIIKNLTAKPATLRSVAELERYLTNDSIIDEAEGPNGFGMDISIREPLLPILAALRHSVPPG